MVLRLAVVGACGSSNAISPEAPDPMRLPLLGSEVQAQLPQGSTRPIATDGALVAIAIAQGAEVSIRRIDDLAELATIRARNGAEPDEGRRGGPRGHVGFLGGSTPGGRQEGRQEGREEGRADALLTVLRVRGLAVSEAEREHILAERIRIG